MKTLLSVFGGGWVMPFQWGLMHFTAKKKKMNVVGLSKSVTAANHLSASGSESSVLF